MTAQEAIAEMNAAGLRVPAGRQVVLAAVILKEASVNENQQALWWLALLNWMPQGKAH